MPQTVTPWDQRNPVALDDEGIPQYTIIPTYRCNLACLYCCQVDKTLSYSDEELQSVVEDIFKAYPGKVSISFYGGEPTLRFDSVKNLFFYIEEHYGDRVCFYDICTNATILTEEMISFFREHKNRITPACSLDGLASANAERIFHNGSPSYNIVVQNLKRMLAEDIPITKIQLTAHRRNVHTIYEGVQHLYELGFRNIKVGVVESTPSVDASLVLNDYYVETFKSEMQRVSQFVWDHSDLNIRNFTKRWGTKREGPLLVLKGRILYHPGNRSRRIFKLYDEVYFAHQEFLKAQYD